MFDIPGSWSVDVKFDDIYLYLKVIKGDEDVREINHLRNTKMEKTHQLFAQKK